MPWFISTMPIVAGVACFGKLCAHRRARSKPGITYGMTTTESP